MKTEKMLELFNLEIQNFESLLSSTLMPHMRLLDNHGPNK